MEEYRVKTDELFSFSKGSTIVKADDGDGYVSNSEINMTRLPDTVVENNPDWFEKIEQVQAGQYWSWNGVKQMFRIQRIEDSIAYYKYLDKGDVLSIGTDYLTKHARNLSTDEIKEALIKEAKRRGYKEGQKVKLNSNTNKINGSLYNYVKWCEGDTMSMGSGSSRPVIYDSGSWAELLDQTPHIEINGNQIEVKNGTVKISCGGTIEEEMYKNFYAVVNKYDLDVSRNGEDINEQLRQIWDEMPSRKVRDFVTGQIPIKIAGRTFYATELDEHLHGKDIRLTTE